MTSSKFVGPSPIDAAILSGVLYVFCLDVFVEKLTFSDTSLFVLVAMVTIRGYAALAATPPHGQSQGGILTVCTVPVFGMM